MMLFPTRKPRQFRYTPRYSRRQGFDFHSGRRPVRRRTVAVASCLHGFTLKQKETNE